MGTSENFFSGERSLYNRNEDQTGGRSGPSYDELRQQNRTEYERKLNTSKFGSSHGTVETKPPSPTSPDPSSTRTSLETESGPMQKGLDTYNLFFEITLQMQFDQLCRRGSGIWEGRIDIFG